MRLSWKICYLDGAGGSMETSHDIRFQDASFAEFLLKSSIVKPGSEPHLVRWVGMFFRLRGKWQNYLWNEQLDFFLAHLSHDRTIPRWQVVQAEQAVRLYFVHFLGTIKKPEPLVEIDEQGMFKRDAAFEQLVTTMRLKRYARRTEKTYMIWLGSYFRFVRTADPACPPGKINGDPRYVKEFLAQLAVRRNVAAGSRTKPSTRCCSFSGLF